MTSQKSPQTMKPATAAKKLGVYLEATPAEFQEGVVSRDELNALQADPPEWLRDLRRDGPHPRPVVAAKLGVSIAGLARGGVTEALTTAQIDALKADQPEWLRTERAIQAEVRREAVRVKEKQAAEEKKAANKAAAPPQRPAVAPGRTTRGVRKASVVARQAERAEYAEHSPGTLNRSRRQRSRSPHHKPLTQRPKPPGAPHGARAAFACHVCEAKHSRSLDTPKSRE